MTLKNMLRSVLFGLLVLAAAGCSGGGRAAGTASGRTVVTLSFGQVRTVSSSEGHGITAKSIPAGVAKLKITVSAPDMVPIERDVDTAGRETITESIDVPNGVNRLFDVQAMDADGVVLYKGSTFADLNGSPKSLAVSMVSSDTLPPLFAGLSGFSGLTQTSVILSWQPSTDSVTPPSKIQYLIYMAEAPGQENFGSPSFTTLPGQTSFEVTGLSPSRPYYFVVRAMDERGNIDSNTVELAVSTLPPPDPVPPVFGGLTAVQGVSSSEVLLSWNPAADNDTAASDMVYLVYMATAAGGENLAVPNYITSPGATSYAVGGLTEGAVYYFIVRARDKSGNIDDNTVEKSAGPLDLTPPVFGGLLSASAISPSSILLSWDAASDNVSQPSAISYLAYVAGTSGGQDFNTPSMTSPAGITTLTLSGMTPGAVYYIVVRAKDAAGNIDANTMEKSVQMPLPADVTPPVFRGLASAAASGTTVTLSWSPATDNVGLAGYDVFVATVSGGENFAAPTLSAPAGATSVNYAAPGGGTTYYFVVRARDAAGNVDSNTVERSATTDIFVSSTTGNDNTGAGTAASPVGTITHAISVTDGKPGVTINVGTGTYGAASGEAFPLNFAGAANRTLSCALPVTPGSIINGAGGDVIAGSPGTAIRNCNIFGRVSDGVGPISIDNATIDGAGTIGAGVSFLYNSSITNSTIRNFLDTGTGKAINIDCAATCNATVVLNNSIVNNNRSVDIANASPTVQGNRISSNIAGIFVLTNATPSILNNQIYSNSGSGLTFSFASASTVTGNTVCGNGIIGIDVAAASAAAVPAIHNNRLYQNTGADLRSFGAATVDATNNAWDNAPPTYGAGVCTGGVDTCSATFPATVTPYLPVVGTTVCP